MYRSEDEIRAAALRAVSGVLLKTSTAEASSAMATIWGIMLVYDELTKKEEKKTDELQPGCD